MSVLKRPYGDELASEYLHIFPSQLTIKQGLQYDILCEDLRHYICEIVAVGENDNITKIHFPHWSSKYDYVGDIKELYLANIGNYSISMGLNPMSNSYPKQRSMGIKYKKKKTYEISEKGYEIGDKIEALFNKEDIWYPGVISHLLSNGTFNIDYDDGDQEFGVEIDFIRKLSTKSKKNCGAARGKKSENFDTSINDDESNSYKSYIGTQCHGNSQDLENANSDSILKGEEIQLKQKLKAYRLAIKNDKMEKITSSSNDLNHGLINYRLDNIESNNDALPSKSNKRLKCDRILKDESSDNSHLSYLEPGPGDTFITPQSSSENLSQPSVRIFPISHMDNQNSFIGLDNKSLFRMRIENLKAAKRHIEDTLNLLESMYERM